MILLRPHDDELDSIISNSDVLECNKSECHIIGMDTRYFIDHCLSIVSEFLFYNAPFVFYDFNHVLL